MASPELIRTFRAMIEKETSDSLQAELDKGVYRSWKRYIVLKELERRSITRPPGPA